MHYRLLPLAHAAHLLLELLHAIIPSDLKLIKNKMKKKRNYEI